MAPTEASALTNRLIEELMKTRSFKVIERAQVEEILKEQGINQSGCVDATCIVEAGKLLGAQIMVAGAVDKIGQTYSVSARLVDVETSQMLLTDHIDHKGEIDGLLQKMRELAQALARSELPSPLLVQLQIIPSPGDAAVYIDGQLIGQGMVTRTVSAGRHTVRVTKNNHVEWEQTVQLDRNQTFAVTLVPMSKPSPKPPDNTISIFSTKSQ